MKISLGTAQFGLDYGVTNSKGKVAINTVGSILELAEKHNIKMIDTAVAYGNSEWVLGHFELSKFNITSKIPRLNKAKNICEYSIHDSLERLNINSLYGLMLHDEDDAIFDQYRYLNEIQIFKKKGLVNKVGASFYSPDKALKVIKSGLVDLIQIPANQLDSRFENKKIYTLADKYGVEVHVRSLFLQGLIVTSDNDRPKQFQGHQDLIKFDQYANNLGLTPVELALMYIHQNENIHYGVIGCTNVKQLKEIIETYNNLKTFQNITIPDLSSSDDILLNPSKW